MLCKLCFNKGKGTEFECKLLYKIGKPYLLVALLDCLSAPLHTAKREQTESEVPFLLELFPDSLHCKWTIATIQMIWPRGAEDGIQHTLAYCLGRFIGVLNLLKSGH